MLSNIIFNSAYKGLMKNLMEILTMPCALLVFRLMRIFKICSFESSLVAIKYKFVSRLEH